MVTGWSDDDEEEAQYAIQYYLDTWLDASVGTDVTYVQSNGMNNVSFISGWSEYMKLPNGNIIDIAHSRGSNLASLSSGSGWNLTKGIRQYEKYAKEAEKNLYNVTIYYFADYPNDGKCHQHVIIVDREEEIPKGQKIPVIKLWNDNNNDYKQRPTSVTVELLFNDKPTGQTLVLNAKNNWYGEFERLNGKGTYTVREKTSVPEYTTEIYGDQNSGFLILNRLSTQINVIKKWDDGDNADEIRPSSITVTLYDEKGVSTGKTKTLSAENNWTASFTNLNKYEIETNANYIKDISELKVKEIEKKYTIKEKSIEGYTTTYETTKDSNNTTITITNTHTPEKINYIEITGKVWEDVPDGKANEINGILDTDESGLGGIKVILKDKNGNQFDETSTTTTNADGTYTIKVKYKEENQAEVQDKLDTAYVEFSFDGLKYTTVKPIVDKDKAGNAVSTAQQSKATEVYSGRENLDNKYSTIKSGTTTIDKLTESDKNIIAITKNIITSFNTYKTIEGNGEEDIIKNVNLGLQKREQPDISIEANISEVEVTANGERNIYKYNAVVTDENNADVKAQFQNKQSYTYRRPVNPTDITYIKEKAQQDAMSGVYVTYEVAVTNEAKTLITTVHSIINCYDNRYILESATINGNKVTFNKSSVYGQSETDFSEITLSDLNIKLNPNETSSKIMLRYKVNAAAVEGLLNEDATLSNAVEIESYSTYYGENTIYAEQEKGGRTNKSYAGYDKDSHPGNAGIKLQEVDYTYTYTEGNGVIQTKTYTNVKVLKSTENLVEYKLADGTIVQMPEDDTDIAPSFLLYKDIPKTLSGTVFEDTDITENEERLGDGKYDSSIEKTIANVKVELYNIDGTLATLYDEEGNVRENATVQYTNEQGNYKFEGLELGKEYYLKFTYGNDTSELPGPTTINGGIEINARNYKSTIITNPIVKGILDKKYEYFTEEDKNWLKNIEDNYSVAVDNMTERIKIEDLQYSNFNKALNMTAYTKPFIAEIGSEKLDFGIIERPREDLFVEKTITNVKITLANGQVLIEGDPRTQSLEYGKAMGFNQNITTSQQARATTEKRLLVEIDAELIQGAKLEVQYAVKATNNNEIDYDYGVEVDYISAENLKDYDKFITTSDKANYYYYGIKKYDNNEDIRILDTTIELVDYLNGELTYKESTNSWDNIEADAIHVENNEQISDETWNDLKSNKYKIFKTSVTLAREQSYEQQFTTVKVLANKDENVYDNNIEIIKIDGKTARTIQEVDGVVVQKTYVPGDYAPTLSDAKEQDDDRVKIIITPPTGIITYIMYIVTAIIGLIVIAIGIKFIKKKVLIK